MQFNYEVKSGKIIGGVKDFFVKAVTKTLSHDGIWEIIIQKQKKKRSNQENNYYWGVIIKIISDHTGMTDKEVHDHLRWQFLRKNVNGIETVWSTSDKDFTTVMAEDYYSKCRIYGSDVIGVYIPEPNETDYFSI